MSLPDFYVPITPPMHHQEECLEKGWEKDFFAFFLEMGMGKSRIAIDNFCMLYSAGLCDCLIIIAPKSVYTNWTRIDSENPGELQKWFWTHLRDQGLLVMTYSASDMRKKRNYDETLKFMNVGRPGPRILVINKEAISATFNARDFLFRVQKTFPKNMVVIDESTSIKNPKSNLTKECIIIGRSALYKRIMTGSPSTGSPSDLFSQFEFLAPGRRILGHRSFTTFQLEFCIVKEIMVQGRMIRTEVGVQNLDKLADLIAPHAFRKRKKDCLDLPEKLFLRREIEMTEEQSEAYKELKRHAMTTVQGEEVTTEIVLTQLMRLHQVLCGHIKTDTGLILHIKNNRVRAMLELLEETDEQCVIWAGYRPDVDVIVRALKETFGPNCVAEWHGGIKQEDREKGENDFQAGRKRFMVSTNAGARGRTWTAATLVIYYSNDSDLEIREQSEDRTHRIGTVGTVTYYDIVIPKTLDEKIIESLKNKKSIARQVLAEGLEAWI